MLVSSLYILFLLKFCKRDEIKLEPYLRSETGIQKVLNPVVAKQPADLYKMNYLSIHELLKKPKFA